jgi:hypothetical protein
LATSLYLVFRLDIVRVRETILVRFFGHNALKSSGTSPNFGNTVAPRKSPVAGSPVRLNAIAHAATAWSVATSSRSGSGVGWLEDRGHWNLTRLSLFAFYSFVNSSKNLYINFNGDARGAKYDTGAQNRVAARTLSRYLRRASLRRLRV